MGRATRSELVGAILFGLASLIVPLLAGIILFDQSRTPMLGVYVDDSDPPIIAEVMSGSGAARAGLRQGDAILAVDRRPYAAWPTADRHLGQSYTFSLSRQGQPLTLQVTVETMLQANRPDAFTAILVAFTFWGVGLLLLRRRFRQMAVRLLFLFYQASAVALLIGLAYPRFRLPPAWMISLAVAALAMAAPLLVHYQLTFPVILGTARQRGWVLAPLYGLAAVGTVDA